MIQRFGKERVKRLNLVFLIFFLLVPFSLFGAPTLEVTSPHHNIGDIHIGKEKFVRHTFKVKNSGTSTLKIKQVRPG